MTKGSLVMLKAKLEDDFFTLAGSTIIGLVNASTVSYLITTRQNYDT